MVLNLDIRKTLDKKRKSISIGGGDYENEYIIKYYVISFLLIRFNPFIIQERNHKIKLDYDYK